MRPARLVLFLALWCVAAVAAPPVTVQNLRLWRAPDNTRLVFDLSGSVEHQVLVLENPDRIVVDLSDARFVGTLPEVDTSNPLLTSIRSGRPEGTTLRFVLDLKRAVKPRSFVLKPVGQYNYRLVLDLIDPRAVAEEERADGQEPAVAPPVVTVPTPAPPQAPSVVTRKRDWVIAIDAGHGGEDPGALGRKYRSREKDVTLAIARELARQVAREPGMKPVLTRDGDYYVGLEQRVKRAKDNQADIFISIHADSLPGRRVAYGSSVFALSERGASSALARALDDQNNQSDLIGGIDLPNMPPDVRKTVIDLALEKKMEHSMLLGEDILTELEKVGRVHTRQVALAGFMVLRSKKEVQMPSVLVETAFISTPEEERKLRSAAYQEQMAGAILRGARNYLTRNGHTAPMPQQVVSDSPREHVVRVGDTLVSIARQYNVSVDVLRFLNELSNDELPIGARLRLPTGS
jgi:N-acetylmuramoyl-L-alanine amidase